MKIGLSTGYWGSGPPAGAAEAVMEAERLGFDSIWTAEAYGSDALTPLAWWGASTSKSRASASMSMRRFRRERRRRRRWRRSRSTISRAGAWSWGWGHQAR